MALYRRDDNGLQLNHTMLTLLVVLLILVIITVILVGTLLFLRQRRRAQKAAAALDSEKRISTSSTSSHHRRINARPSQSIHIYNDKEMAVSDSTPPSPTSSLPEIRITFPEEVDATGKRQSGRVVVVHVGDNGLGLEPVSGEKLPAYEAGGRFQSIDLERVGGLMEKETRAPLGWKS